jgi:thioredoxin
MKSLLCLLPLVLFGLGSCEKIRALSAQLKKKPAAAAKAYTGLLVTEIPDGGYAEFTQQTNRLAIVDFYADWCGPCRRLSPLLDQIATEHGGTVVIGKVNVDRCRELATREGIRSIPELRMFRDGKLVDKFVGLPSESDLRQRIECHSQGLTAPVAEAAEAGKPKPTQPTVQPMSKDWMPSGIQRR